ncbi:MAG: hypothetical protein M3280_03385 [Actinomycetota bacterium]|nr:hypothetical protein [Actinomycetota bacterium]
MAIRRIWGDFGRLRREFRAFGDPQDGADESARYRLTVSARRFSRRTKDVVDDKLSFSATLMRAGEVDAANRLLEEVERDVRTEEAALIETMNEMKLARVNRRQAMTRVRLARMVAVSVVGSMLMGFSALGMAAASFLQDREQSEAKQNHAALRRAEHSANERLAQAKAGLDKDVKKVLAGMSLSASELRTIQRLTDGGVDVGALESFLMGVLDSPDLARRVANKIVSQVVPVLASAQHRAKGVVSDVPDALTRAKRKARAAEEAAQKEEQSEDTTAEEEATEAEEEVEENGKKKKTDNDGDGDKDGSRGGGELPEDLPFD